VKISKDEVWSALEQLVSEKLEQRKNGLQKIVELQAIDKYPLVVYVVSTRLVEPDISLRADVVRLIATFHSINYQKKESSKEIFKTLYDYFDQIRNRQIYSLLQVAIYDTSLVDDVSYLIGLCSYAGRYLTEIVTDRKNPLELRVESLKIIESVGFIDVLPELNRILSRYERKNDSKPLRVKENGIRNDREVLIPLLGKTIEALEEK
jgi:hypothetical protein